MPNNGIVSKKTNIPLDFRATSTGEFDTATDMVVISQPTTGINVTQSAVTIDQLGELVSASQTPSNFDVATSGNIIISKNEGVYGGGPENIETGDLLTISNVEIPQGLTWMGEYSGTQEYNNSDVVYSIVSTTYTTWVYINENPSTGQALPTSPSTFNTYWAQLGTQGPAGSNGVTAVNGLTGNVIVSNTELETTSTSWDISVSETGNDIKVGINKPYKEFITKFPINGPGSLPGINQVVGQYAIVNEIGATSLNSSVSYSGGVYSLSLPAGTFSSADPDKIYITATEYSTANLSLNTWKYYFKTNFSWGSNKINFKVYQWDQTTGSWLSDLAISTYVTLLFKVRIYN